LTDGHLDLDLHLYGHLGRESSRFLSRTTIPGILPGPPSSIFSLREWPLSMSFVPVKGSDEVPAVGFLEDGVGF